MTLKIHEGEKIIKSDEISFMVIDNVEWLLDLDMLVWWHFYIDSDAKAPSGQMSVMRIHEYMQYSWENIAQDW